MGDFILEQINADDKILLKRDDTYTFGRERNNEIIRVSPLISRKHCVFIVTASCVKIIDSGSSNGVYLNGNQIPPHTPIQVKIDDIIGIACGDIHNNIQPDSFVYRLKRQENGSSLKRKLKTEFNDVPVKVLKTEPRDDSEIIILDDDDVPAQNNIVLDTTKLSENESTSVHPLFIKKENIVENNHCNTEIELIDLEEFEPISDNLVSTSTGENNQQIPIAEIPQELVTSNLLVPKQEFISTEFINYQNIEPEESDPLKTNANFHFIKCENVSPLEEEDIFSDFSPEPSTSNVKQEVTSTDCDDFNSHYSQTELVCLSDDEEEEINFPRSQLFDEIIISDEIHNDNVTNVKREPMAPLEDPIDPYDGSDDIPLIELTDDEIDDDHEDDDNTKVWLQKLMSSQLENQIVQIKVQPPEEENQFIGVEFEGNEEQQIPDVEYGQLNDMREYEIGQEVVEGHHFMHITEELPVENKEFEDEINQKNREIEAKKRLMDSNVSNKSDNILDIKVKARINKHNKKKNEKRLEIRNKQKSIKKPKPTSDKILNLQIKDLDKVDTECHSSNIDRFMVVDETRINKIENVKHHDKKRSKKESKNNKTEAEKISDSEKINSEEMDATSSKSPVLFEERDDLDSIKALEDSDFSEKSDSTVDNKESTTKERCVNIWNKKGKKIEQVDPPFFPKGGRRAVSINITATTSGNLRDSHSSDDDLDIFTSNKTITTSSKKEDKHTEDARKKEKQLKRLQRKFSNDTSSTTENQKLSNEQKRKIKEQRNERLKQLQNKIDGAKISENKADKSKRINRPKVKISEKNRGAFLTPDDTNSDSINKHLHDSAVESLFIPKIQELRQNTAAQDLSDVISSSAVSFSNDKTSLNSENKTQQKIAGKENHREVGKMNVTREVVMKEEISQKINIENNHVSKTKPTIKSNVSINLPNIKHYKERCDGMQVIQPLRGILRALQNNTSTTKKKVRFNDKTKIQVYLIEEGNKIEKKCTQKDMKIGKKFSTYNLNTAKVDCPKIESFLFKVFQWRPVWLSEQQGRHTPPPIVDKIDKSAVSLTYSSYTEYYNIMSTLILLEMWYVMTKEYEKLQKRPVLYASVVEQSISDIIVDYSSNKKITTFMIEALITEQALRTRHHPVYGDLVMLELAVIHQEKIKYSHVFAYITAMNYTTITPSTRYNTALNKLTKDPHTLVTYTMMTKTPPFALQPQKPGRLKTVIYLRSHLRMVQALHYLPQSPLLEAVLHPTLDAYKLPFVPYYESLTLVTKSQLNLKQRESVFRIAEAVINQKPGIFLVQGPPGTGKSKVIINLITEILYGRKKNEGGKSMKILVCAPSNAAIDEIVLRLKTIRSSIEDPAYKFKLVRIGRLEAVSPAVRSFHVTEFAKREVEKTLIDYNAAKKSSESIEKQKEHFLTCINALIEENSAENISEMQKQHISSKLACLRAKYELFSNNNSSKIINPKLRERMRQTTENTILAGANIIACTLSSCYTHQMESIFGKNKGKISVCIVDEATQSSEPETLIPLMLGVTSLVLVGDPNQLPATIISQQAKRLGFDRSLFARIHKVFKRNSNNPVVMLNTQYRMSDRIMHFPNRYFYNNAVHSEPPKERLPFHFYKVFNLSSHQNDSNKFSNTDEAIFVANLIYTMAMNAPKIRNLGIGIITPYNDQRTLVNQKIIDRMENVPEEIKKRIMIEVNTVDSFQGQERDVVIMSCVRSNGIGFLSDRQRLCVALTRAKFSLVLCGNFKTFEKDPMWFELLKDAKERNIYINLDHTAEPENIKEFIIR